MQMSRVQATNQCGDPADVIQMTSTSKMAGVWMAEEIEMPIDIFRK
jgi:hypothetical protein